MNHDLGRGDFPEIIITPFPPKMWSDLWRIEFDVLKGPSLYAEVLDLFRDLKIDILMSETTALGGVGQHTLSFIVDLSNYSQLYDLDSNSRQLISNPQMKTLNTILTARFIKCLIFYDPQSPRIRIRRLQSYYSCFQRIGAAKPSIQSISTIRSGFIKLEKKFIVSIYSMLAANKKDKLKAMILSDSKDRVIRALFCIANHGIIHFRVHLSNDQTALREVIKTINNSNFEIVRSQTRVGLYYPEGNFPKYKYDSMEFLTIDLLLRSLSPDPKQKDYVLECALRDRLRKNQVLRGYKIHSGIAHMFKRRTL